MDSTDEGVYYVRAKNSRREVFGKKTEYQLKVGRIMAPPFQGYISGEITNAVDGIRSNKKTLRVKRPPGCKWTPSSDRKMSRHHSQLSRIIHE
jgi:hypothetical protein